MSLEIIKKETNYIIIKVPIDNKQENFLQTEEIIEEHVNELGRILTKDAMEKLDIEEKVIEREGKNITLKKKQKKYIKPPMEV